jgi:hypothetical protein
MPEAIQVPVLYKPRCPRAAFLGFTSARTRPSYCILLHTTRMDRRNLALDNLMGEKARVLLVDEDPMLRRVMRRVVVETRVELDRVAQTAARSL